jgi:hypothetical protein
MYDDPRTAMHRGLEAGVAGGLRPDLTPPVVDVDDTDMHPAEPPVDLVDGGGAQVACSRCCHTVALHGQGLIAAGEHLAAQAALHHLAIDASQLQPDRLGRLAERRRIKAVFERLKSVVKQQPGSGPHTSSIATCALMMLATAARNAGD